MRRIREVPLRQRHAVGRVLRGVIVGRGRLPGELLELAPKAGRRDAQDPYGQTSELYCDSHGLVIYSFGEDARRGTAVDIWSVRNRFDVLHYRGDRHAHEHPSDRRLDNPAVRRRCVPIAAVSCESK